MFDLVELLLRSTFTAPELLQNGTFPAPKLLKSDTFTAPRSATKGSGLLPSLILATPCVWLPRPPFLKVECWHAVSNNTHVYTLQESPLNFHSAPLLRRLSSQSHHACFIISCLRYLLVCQPTVVKLQKLSPTKH